MWPRLSSSMGMTSPTFMSDPGERAAQRFRAAEVTGRVLDRDAVLVVLEQWRRDVDGGGRGRHGVLRGAGGLVLGQDIPSPRMAAARDLHIDPEVAVATGLEDDREAIDKARATTGPVETEAADGQL